MLHRRSVKKLTIVNGRMNKTLLIDKFNNHFIIFHGYEKLLIIKATHNVVYRTMIEFNFFNHITGWRMVPYLCPPLAKPRSSWFCKKLGISLYPYLIPHL